MAATFGQFPANFRFSAALFPRAQPEGTPETECWYFPVLPDSSRCTDIIQFLKVMKP